MITQINLSKPEIELRIKLPIILREGDLIDLEWIIDYAKESYYKTTKKDFIDYMEDEGSSFIVTLGCLNYQANGYEWHIIIEK